MNMKQKRNLNKNNFSERNLVPENVDWDTLIDFVESDIVSRSTTSDKRAFFWDYCGEGLDVAWGLVSEKEFDDTDTLSCWVDSPTILEHNFKNYFIKFMKGVYEKTNIFTKYDDSCVFDDWIEDWYVMFIIGLPFEVRIDVILGFCPNGINHFEDIIKNLSSLVEKWKKEIYELLDVFTENNFSMDIPLTTLN